MSSSTDSHPILSLLLILAVCMAGGSKREGVKGNKDCMTFCQQQAEEGVGELPTPLAQCKAQCEKRAK